MVSDKASLKNHMSKKAGQVALQTLPDSALDQKR